MACTVNERNSYKILVEKLLGRHHLTEINTEVKVHVGE
jgi:hypothetical protein